MGFVLSILYFVTNYLTAGTLFGPLAAYRIELILAVLIVLASLHLLLESFIFKTPQSLALIGLAVAVFLSLLIGQRWFGGGVQAVLAFVPNAFAYFLICLHCNSKRKLQVVVAMLLFVCLFVIAHGSYDLFHGVQANAQAAADRPDLPGTEAIDLWNAEHPYLFEMDNPAGGKFYRLRGLGLINDPNDFGQLTVCVMPLLFIFWRQKKWVQNALFVIVPLGCLLFGLYLTHSRGALVALTAVALVAVRRRIGTVPALVLAAGLFFGAMSLQFTGGREISADAGEDRTALWSEGLQVLKANPVFGVGFGNLSDYTEEHLTAHNSVIVCAAEIGVFGFFFWSMFLFSTLRDALSIASPLKVNEGEPELEEAPPFPQAERKIEPVDKAEINGLGRLLVLSLTGFLTAGMFLSRAFVPTLFLLGGMVEVVFEMALDRGMIARRMSLVRVLGYAAIVMVSLVTMMYLIVRILNMMH